MFLEKSYWAHIAAITAVLASVIVYSQGRAREQYPGQYDNVKPEIQAWYKSQRNKSGGSCCTDADDRIAPA